MMNTWFSCAIFITVCIFASSCEGEIPPYEDPRDVFRGATNGLYVIGSIDNSMKVFLTATNTFDETFQGQAVLEGEIQIVLARDGTIQKTFSISSANLIPTSNYNPTTRVLTIDRGGSIKFEVSWDFVDDSGRDLRQNTFRYVPDTTCAVLGRKIAAPEDFSLRGEVKVYEQIDIVRAMPKSFRMCHVNFWVSSKECPPIVGCPQ
ncbi:MAG TPA: hypothetical protein VI704_05865 [Bacteroidota bacterium]|nr:hypothetical protein [Bacteroidota bacterium]